MMVSGPHALLEELIVADALDGLDEADRTLLAGGLAEHGESCLECRRLIAEYSEVAGHLAMSLDPVPLADRAEEQLIRAAQDRLGGFEEELGRAPEAAEGAVTRPGPGRVGRWVAAAAAAAVLAVAAGIVGYALAPGGQGVRLVTLSGAPGEQLAVAFQPGRPEAWVMGSNVSEPGEGQVYELWFSRPGSSAMEPAGTFVPESGSVLAEATLGEEVDLLAVSIERAPGGPVPRGEVVFSAPVPPS